MDPQIKRTMRASISWKPFNRYDGRGTPVYHPAKSLSCYLVPQIQMIRNKDGEEVVSSVTLYLDGNTEAPEIQLEDSITLPDGRTPPIIALPHYYDERGNLDLVGVQL